MENNQISRHELGFSKPNPYQELYSRFGNDSRSLGWSKESQNSRFERIYRLFSFDGSNILDVGSGFSDFLFFLVSKGVKLQSYMGLEPFYHFYNEAKGKLEKLPNQQYSLLMKDWENFDSNFKFDVGLAIGSFNFRIQDNYSYLVNFIRVMLENNCDNLIISLLSKNATQATRNANTDKFFYDPNVISNLLYKRNVAFEIVHDYLPHDFIVKARK